MVCRRSLVARPCILFLRQYRLAVLDRNRRHLHFAVVLKAVGGQLNGDGGQRLALDGHGHRPYREIIVVLISHDLVIDGVGSRVGGLGDGRSIGSCRAVQRVPDFAAAGLARNEQLMGLAVVGDIGCGWGRIEDDIGLFDYKCRRTRHGVIAVRPVDDVDRSGITGVCVVFVADIIFACSNSCTAVNDCNLGLFGTAVIGIADKGIPALAKQRDGRVLHRLGGDSNRYLPHCGIAVVDVALYLIIHLVSSSISLGGDLGLKGYIIR